MIPNVGPLEIAIVLIIALIVFGPKRLPELGRSVGSGIKEFREGLSNMGNDLSADDDDDPDDDPVAISPATPDPEVKEILRDDPAEAAEPVDGEVVTEPRD
jgi:sec-independent protein translocase protein TatA